MIVDEVDVGQRTEKCMLRGGLLPGISGTWIMAGLYSAEQYSAEQWAALIGEQGESALVQ